MTTQQKQRSALGIGALLLVCGILLAMVSIRVPTLPAKIPLGTISYFVIAIGLWTTVVSLIKRCRRP